MITADLIAKHFGINYRVIQMQTQGLTHEESLLQPPFRGNCLNWVLGHIVAGRNGALRLLGEDPIWSEAEAAPYKRESEPLTNPEQAHQLEKIIAALDRSQERLMAALARISQEDLEKVKREQTIGERLTFSFWHEGYHTGQTEYLRQLAGKDDKVI